jgi:hypothetical protein
MSQKERAEWQPFETAHKDGTELIFWISSQKWFQDTIREGLINSRLR